MTTMTADLLTTVAASSLDFVSAATFYSRLSDELVGWDRAELDLPALANSRRQFVHDELDRALDDVERARGVWP